jgi:hypothetical protein
MDVSNVKTRLQKNNVGRRRRKGGQRTEEWAVGHLNLNIGQILLQNGLLFVQKLCDVVSNQYIYNILL